MGDTVFVYPAYDSQDDDFFSTLCTLPELPSGAAPLIDQAGDDMESDAPVEPVYRSLTVECALGDDDMQLDSLVDVPLPPRNMQVSPVVPLQVLQIPSALYRFERTSIKTMDPLEDVVAELEKQMGHCDVDSLFTRESCKVRARSCHA
jgi:hypothetical protein